MKKLLVTLLLVVLFQSSVLADFSRSQAELHPRFPASNPFIIEINGTWPTDCHPGEQKPLIESFDGHTVRIGFEIIVVHVTCNIRDTDYRVLVDMSEVVRTTKPLGDLLEVQASFQETTLELTLELVCPQDRDCADLAEDQQRPDPGLYYAQGLANQGLLVARQNAAMAIFPLTYDGSGRSEWLFSGNLMVEDSFFTEILRMNGGDCFGCDPTGTVPEMTPIGHLSVLADRPGVLQVKVNDGLFVAYQSLVFGYQVFQVGPAGEKTLIDLEGRWAISKNRGMDSLLGDLMAFFPGSFDIELKASIPADSEIPRAGQVNYLVTALSGEILGELACKGQADVYSQSNICEFIDATDQADPLFLFYQRGPSSIAIEYGRPLMAVGIAPGGEVTRLD